MSVLAKGEGAVTASIAFCFTCCTYEVFLYDAHGNPTDERERMVVTTPSLYTHFIHVFPIFHAWYQAGNMHTVHTVHVEGMVVIWALPFK